MRFAARRLGPLAVLAGALMLGASAACGAPAMWEVSDSDSKVTLFGSVHVLPIGTQWRTPAFDAALRAAPEVYFETDIGPWGEFALTMKMLGAAMSASQRTWTDTLTPAQLQQLKDTIGPLGLKFETVADMPPWAVEVELQLAQMNTGKETLDPFKGVDATLEWELPKERKAYFETPGQQYDLLASDPLDVQIQKLFAAIDSAEATPSLDAIVSAWTSGDVDAIAATNVPQSPDDVVETQRILLDRNANWIPVIEKMLVDNRQDLIVVGAAHLAGPGSVLDLLAKAGYSVTRVQ